MAKINAQIVTDLTTARDNLIDAMAAGAGVVEIEVRGKKVRRENFYQSLMEIERLIKYYSGSSSRSRRSQARIKRVK